MPAIIVRLTVIPLHQAVLEQNVAAAVKERVAVAISPLHVAVYLAVTRNRVKKINPSQANQNQ